MGACGGKSQQGGNKNLTKEQKSLAKDKFEIGPEIFVNLKLGDITKDYTISKILGEGSYGQVRLVTQKQSNQQRAMKQIAKDKILKEQEQDMFNEVALLKNMDHPNIVRLYELYQDDKNYFLVTEFLTGGELLDKITKQKVFTEKMAAEYMKQIMSALAYCHAEKIIHRDLKPANIMFESNDPQARIKVIDFGTAKKTFSGEKQQQLIGTPLYIAPEVIQKNYTEKCDIWSCGIMLYQIMTGKFPFNVKVGSLQQLFGNITSGKFNYNIPEFTSMSKEGQIIIQKMLNMDPSKRPSAQEILNDPWVQSNSKVDSINPDVLSNLGNFNNQNQLRAAIMQLIVSQMMQNNEKDQLIQSFQTMDANKDGQLSKEELQQGYMKVYHDELKAKHMVEQVFARVDSNNSGKLSYTEFVVAATEQQKLLSKARVEQTFKMFDRDGNGVITAEEIKEVMCGVDIGNDGWKQIIQECDKNGDGQISHDEFVNLLLKSQM